MINKLCLFVFLFSLTTTLSGNAQEAKRPNILILLGDDIDRDSLGPWGGQAITPNLNQLAKDGMRFDNVYANVAMCAPFRQELYSGRTAWRTRAMPNHSRSIAGTKSLPHYLRPLGYRVGLLGKNHVGPRVAYPFDKVGDLPMKQDPNPMAVKRARKYMTEARDQGKPFCLVVASHDGHGPYTHGVVSQYDAAKFELDADVVDTAEYRKNMAKHLAEVTNLDALLGQLRSILAEEKLAENTLVLFCSEQGNAFPFAKWTCFSDGLASGVVAALPGVIPSGKSNDQVFWISDVAPTLLEAAGGRPNEDDFDGRSQWRNFKGENNRVHDYVYGAFSNCNIIDNRDRVFPIRTIRDQRFTLIWSPRSAEEITSNTTLSQALEWIESNDEKGVANVAGSWVLTSREKNATDHVKKLVHRLHHRPEWALYDRLSDSEELENLMADPKHKEVANRLKRELESWLGKWKDSDPVATEQSFVTKH